MLSDPLEVLSSSAYVLSVAGRRGDSRTLLCRLLILVYLLLSQFDGEEGLHAGVQIEGFTGPARSGDAGVGVLEAVHSAS